MSSISLPVWIRERKLNLGELHEVRSVMSRGGLHTVCDEARCPNRSECFSRGTATFLIMGDVCTRSCRYCSIAHGRPRPLDAGEPAELARAAQTMGLKHVVVTSVDRDDLPDGGAAHFAAVITELKKLEPRPTVEVLTPDFRGDAGAVAVVLAAGPDVYNHNVETVRRLYPQVRRQGRYDWALEVIEHVARRGNGLVTKSGLMVGLGETREELEATLRDLEAVTLPGGDDRPVPAPDLQRGPGCALLGARGVRGAGGVRPLPRARGNRRAVRALLLPRRGGVPASLGPRVAQAAGPGRRSGATSGWGDGRCAGVKILALERDVPGVTDEQFGPHLKAEATRAWALHQQGAVRELYFRADEDAAVLVLECGDLAEAERLASLPLVREGLIAFDLIPLQAYPGFARLFATDG